MIDPQRAAAAGFEISLPAVAGGQSWVYKAFHPATGKHVALKLFKPTPRNAHVLREATALASIDSAHVAGFVAAGYIDQHPYLATHWVDGTRLSELIQQAAINSNRLTPQQVGDIIDGIARGLQAAHQQRQSHGDLTPANIIRAMDGSMVLIDFGLACSADDETLSLPESLGGTPRYVAPEIIAGNRPSAKADQYALAVIAYELLTGSWPFDAASSTASVTGATALHHQLYSPPVAASERIPALSNATDRVLLRALSKRPHQRFDDVIRFSHQLRTSLKALDTRGKTKRRRPAPWPWIAFAAGAGLAAAATPLSTTHKAAATATVATVSPRCNLMPNPGFDTALDYNFYQDAARPHLNKRVSDRQYETAPVLQLGDKDRYGLYGQIVEIHPQQQYQLSADVWLSEDVFKAELRVSWLDTDWQLMNDVTVIQLIVAATEGRQVLTPLTPPDGARYAVPTIYKDAFPGTMQVDNIVFTTIDKRC